LRIYRLSSSPPTLNWDEAAWGYNAYSLMKTGKDEYGVRLPVFTRSFDEYKPALPSYLMIPFISYFGLTENAVRLPSSILGSINIILLYFLVLTLFKNTRYALLSAFLYAVEPWAVHMARVYHDANIALFFLLMGLLLYISAKKRSYLIVFSALFMGLSWFTYNANKLLVPLFLAFLLFCDRKYLKSLHTKYKRISFGIITAFFVIFLYFVLKGQMFARVGSTHIFTLWTGLPSNLKEFVFANPVYQMFWQIVGRYMAYFSPANLFVREPLEPATVLAGNSIFHPFEFVPWAVGLYLLLKKYKNKYLLALIFLAPIPAALTWNWFQPGRALTLFVTFSIVIAIGLDELIRFFSLNIRSVKIFLYLALVGFLITRAIYVFDSIHVQLVHRDSPNWQPGFDLIVPKVMAMERSFETVLIDSPHAQPYIFYLFYGKFDPERYYRELDLEAIGTPRHSFDFGKFIFRDLNWQVDKNMENTLFVASPDEFQEGGLAGFRSETIFDVNAYPIAMLVYGI